MTQLSIPLVEVTIAPHLEHAELNRSSTSPTGIEMECVVQHRQRVQAGRLSHTGQERPLVCTALDCHQWGSTRYTEPCRCFLLRRQWQCNRLLHSGSRSRHFQGPCRPRNCRRGEYLMPFTRAHAFPESITCMHSFHSNRHRHHVLSHGLLLSSTVGVGCPELLSQLA